MTWCWPSSRCASRSGRLTVTFLCVPSARSQPGGYALGAQAGQEAIRQVAEQAGFTPVPPGRRNPVQRRLRGTSLKGEFQAAFLKDLQAICPSEPRFRNLDVRGIPAY